jgi:hypothetical protein
LHAGRVHSESCSAFRPRCFRIDSPLSSMR